MKAFVSEKDAHNIEDYRRRMSLHRDETREENITEALEELAQSKPSILAGDEGDYTILHSATHSLHHPNIVVDADSLESGNDIVNMTTEEIALKEEEIDEGDVLTT